MADQMQWSNALSTRPSLEAAISEVVEQAVGKLSKKANLGIAFISSVLLPASIPDFYLYLQSN